MEIKDLKIGDRFYVINGNWYGHIEEIMGKPYIYVEKTKDYFPLNDTTHRCLNLVKVNSEGEVSNYKGRLFDSEVRCKHKIKALPSGGIKCTKCGGWFCF